jgi:hypothetical protein
VTRQAGRDMNAARGRSMGRLAIAISVVGAFNLLTIILFYTVAGFFGPMNDAGIGVFGVLVAVLARMLFPFSREQARRPAQVGLIAAYVGAGVVVLGSILVLFRVTGWFLAGLVTTLGYALSGIWMIVVNDLARQSLAWPRLLSHLGVAIGAIMLLGVLVAPGIIAGVDAMAGAPWYVLLGYANGFGWFLLLPAWSAWLGWLLLSGRLSDKDLTTRDGLVVKRPARR